MRTQKILSIISLLCFGMAAVGIIFALMFGPTSGNGLFAGLFLFPAMFVAGFGLIFWMIAKYNGAFGRSAKGPVEGEVVDDKK